MNPLIAQRADSTRWFSGIYLAEDVDSLRASVAGGGWIDPAIGGIATGLDTLAAVTDPLGQLASWGVGWLIEHLKPLSDALDALAGDPDQINAYAQTWRNVGGAIGDAQQRLEESAGRRLAEWTGSVSAAYHGLAAGQAAALATLAQAGRTMGEITAGAGLLVATVRMMVRDLIADFVSVLAVRLWEWLAEEGLTLGLATPWVIAQVTTLAGKWIARIVHLLRGLAASLRRLEPLIRGLGDIVARIKGPTRRSHLFHGDADPLRKHGPARVTHPAEWDAALREAEESSVEVRIREGVMAYGPGARAGRPGQLLLDPDASYGALLHELNHLREDRDAGWAGMAGWMSDPRVRYENEVRSYQKEIEYARSIGDQASVDRLHELLQAEYHEIFRTDS
jgi:hypothetical protein